MNLDLTLPRSVRYHRQLEHGDFSLEANTEAAPEAGHFYLLQRGSVVLRSDDFHAAEAAYRDLCREHWEFHLVSEILARRMASAWGLLGMEPAHRAAARVIESDGRPEDQQRLVRMRQKQRSQLQRQARLAATGR